MRIDTGPHQRPDLDKVAADLARSVGDHAGGGDNLQLFLGKRRSCGQRDDRRRKNGKYPFPEK
jgi:hypothetical protein